MTCQTKPLLIIWIALARSCSLLSLLRRSKPLTSGCKPTDDRHERRMGSGIGSGRGPASMVIHICRSQADRSIRDQWACRTSTVSDGGGGRRRSVVALRFNRTSFERPRLHAGEISRPLPLRVHELIGAAIERVVDGHLIDNFFCKLKEFKRVAMRADKTDQSFAANIPSRRSPDKLSMNLNSPSASMGGTLVVTL
jgi:hypothetical protein